MYQPNQKRVYICVCVRERALKRERERERMREAIKISKLINLASTVGSLVEILWPQHSVSNIKGFPTVICQPATPHTRAPVQTDPD